MQKLIDQLHDEIKSKQDLIEEEEDRERISRDRGFIDGLDFCIELLRKYDVPQETKIVKVKEYIDRPVFSEKPRIIVKEKTKREQNYTVLKKIPVLGLIKEIESREGTRIEKEMLEKSKMFIIYLDRLYS